MKTLATDKHRHEQTDTDKEEREFLYKDLTYKIIGAAIDVRKELGLGFLEKVYENALMVMFRKVGIEAEQQAAVDVQFQGEKVGHYVADILVGGKVIVEIKCAERICAEHRAQVMNYLKATGLRVALIINFGSSDITHERFVL